ncbi:ribonuclease E inhibitor RraB [Streptomyces pharetrae]|uniref:ribonuclease E inhibitor RraB n=1 Tax=Streptomyces pharetrae TaxID=291370 RepID=UPI003346DB38
MTSRISYTHWAYFPTQTSAQRCQVELGEYVTRLHEPQEGDSLWLLLAGRDVDPDHLEQRHAEVEAIVTRHGGNYDGGEATYLAGEPVADPLITDRTPPSV